MARHRTGSVKVEKGGAYARVIYVDGEGRSRQMKRRARSRAQAEKLMAALCDDLRKQGIENPKGSILVEKSTIWARVTYVGSDGKRAQKRRRADNKTHARELIDELLSELKDHGAESLEADRLTFQQLAKKYEASELVHAVYADGHKIHGRRSLAAPKRFLKVLADWFGTRRVRTITHSDVQEYKIHRLQQDSKRRVERDSDERKKLSVASINRELETLRAVFNYAKRQGWMQKSPFEAGKALITKSAEKERERILSKSEEQALVAQCVDRRAHLRALIIAALDTALRRGELFKLQWSDVDFNTGEIHIRATTTKTLSERIVNMTSRVEAELRNLWERSTKATDSLVFGITTDIKHSFTSACDEAAIKGFRFHDLRHTATTRMIESGMPMEQVMKVTGHTQMKTFLRYVNVDERQTKRIAIALDVYNTKLEDELTKPATEAVN
jgi:integrase